jgi:hypothetical protein
MPLGVPPRRFFFSQGKWTPTHRCPVLRLFAPSPLAAADRRVVLCVRRHSTRAGSVLSFYTFVLLFGTLCLAIEGVCVMKKFVVISFGLLLALAAASPVCWGVQVQFVGPGPDFLVPANWDIPANAPQVAPATNAGNQYFVNGGNTSTYATNDSTTVPSLIIGGTPTPGGYGTDGTLNMSNGSLTISGGNDSFQIARDLGDPLAGGTIGVMNMTGTAQLTAGAGSADCCTVGARDRGELYIRDNAVVTTPNTYWRVGNYGPSNDDGLGPLQGDGLISIEGNGQFNGMFMFLGVSDGKGELRISGHGAANFTGGDLIPNVNTNMPDRLALVHLIGSTATLNAQNLQSENGAAEVHNQYLFEADSGGVSPIKLVDAVNIGHNDLTVDLGSFTVLPGVPLTLFDAAPNRIFGTFDNVTVTGGNAAQLHLVYNQASGDIYLSIPEPSTSVLLCFAFVLAVFVKGRASK